MSLRKEDPNLISSKLLEEMISNPHSYDAELLAADNSSAPNTLAISC